MRNLNPSKLVCVILAFCAATAIASPAQTFTTITDFNWNDGAQPYFLSLVQGPNGDFYGTTFDGGINAGGLGTVFKITPSGALTTLHSFAGAPTDGGIVHAGLALGVDGDFYGVTFEGGPSACTANLGCGTVFKITAGGTLTTLHNFNSADGSGPRGRLVQAANGNFYGTTYTGGTNGYGTVFKITPAGVLTTLHSLNYTDGAYPIAGLVQGIDGNFYGTTSGGGTFNGGTVFKITPAGTLTPLHHFDFTEGFAPSAGMVQNSDGIFYGTALGGGTYNAGTAFTITPSGTLTVVHNFEGYPSDGQVPYGTLVQGTDGNFYGATSAGGNDNNCQPFACGTIYKMTPAGVVTILHNFNGLKGGYLDLGGVVQGTDGKFYGTSQYGGTYGWGTAFSLSVGLGPFVETIPASGKVGTSVTILGNNLLAATGVSFNGTAAAFTGVSNSEIRTTVPVGATTGTVQVALPANTLKSNMKFRVTP